MRHIKKYRNIVIGKTAIHRMRRHFVTSFLHEFLIAARMTCSTVFSTCVITVILTLCFSVPHVCCTFETIRSADHGDLVVPRVRSTRFGSRSFRVCDPTMWNKLPQDLRSTDTRKQFKCSYSSVLTAGGASDRRRLKTYLLTYLPKSCTLRDKYVFWLTRLT